MHDINLRALENLDFVSVGIGDEGHFPLPGGEFFAPTAGPDFNAVVFEFIAIGDDVRDSNAGVHEVFRNGDLVVRRVSEFEKVVVTGKMEEGELVSLRRSFLLPEVEADFLVECDGGGGV